MHSHSITSPHNQRVKDAIKLRGRRQRAHQDRCLIDGAREILRAIEAGVPLVELFICQPLCHSDESRRIVERMDQLGCTVWHVTPEVNERLAFGERADGVLAVARTPRPTLDALEVPDDALVAVLCGLEKPGNVGAILRSADAAGVAAVIVADPGTDLYNPNCIRASLGTVFTQPVCQATTAQTLAWLRKRNARIFAAQLGATRSYTEVDYRGSAAIVLGSEAGGLTPEWQAPDVVPIKLPMRGAGDSLNVSAAAAVLFYEALRQRGTA